MGLRDISIREEYRSDKNDIVTEFFVPCLGNCIEYDRCVEYVSLKSLTTLSLGFDDFIRHKAKMRIISGHRFGAHDLDMISRLYESENMFKMRDIKDAKIRLLKQVVENNQLEIKVAIPDSEEVEGAFTEKMGIFIDERGDVVAFAGTSNEMFDTVGRNFESIDVFTSWNDRSRVDTKIRDFEELWENNTKYLEVYSFRDAIRHNLVKYSSHWAIRD